MKCDKELNYTELALLIAWSYTILYRMRNGKNNTVEKGMKEKVIIQKRHTVLSLFRLWQRNSYWVMGLRATIHREPFWSVLHKARCLSKAAWFPRTFSCPETLWLIVKFCFLLKATLVTRFQPLCWITCYCRCLFMLKEEQMHLMTRETLGWVRKQNKQTQ